MTVIFRNKLHGSFAVGDRNYFYRNRTAGIELQEIQEGKSVVRLLFFGTGAAAVNFFRMRNEYRNIYNDDIISIADNDKNKWGDYFFDIEILSPEDAIGKFYDMIVISSTKYTEEIRNELRSKYGISDTIIVDLRTYISQKVITFQCKKNFEMNRELKERYKFFNKESFVIYTAIIGDYDELKEPLAVDSNAHYVCFTDQNDIKSNIWEIRHIKKQNNEDNALCTRRFKMLPHKLFPEYDTSIWLDAAFLIKGKLSEMFQYQHASDFLLFPHGYRICSYEEIAACIIDRLASKNELLQQTKTYLIDEFPANYGLFMGSCLIRNHNEKNVIATMEEWFLQVSRYSKRDQISLPYAIWKNSLRYDLIDEDVFDNPWVIRLGHKHIQDARGPKLSI